MGAQEIAENPKADMKTGAESMQMQVTAMMLQEANGTGKSEGKAIQAAAGAVSTEAKKVASEGAETKEESKYDSFFKPAAQAPNDDAHKPTDARPAQNIQPKELEMPSIWKSDAATEVGKGAKNAVDGLADSKKETINFGVAPDQKGPTSVRTDDPHHSLETSK
jgi:hypothetical protein